MSEGDQLKALVAALRAWTHDPSNCNWRPVQAILDELNEPGGEIIDIAIVPGHGIPQNPETPRSTLNESEYHNHDRRMQDEQSEAERQ